MLANSAYTISLLQLPVSQSLLPCCVDLQFAPTLTPYISVHIPPNTLSTSIPSHGVSSVAQPLQK